MSDVQQVCRHQPAERTMTSRGHLVKTGDAGANRQAALCAAVVVTELVAQWRSRPHEAHIASEDIRQLRDLVQAPDPQQAAHAGYARIVGQLSMALRSPDVTGGKGFVRGRGRAGLR